MIDYKIARIALFKRFERPDDKQQGERRKNAKYGVNNARNERLKCSVLKTMIREGQNHEKLDHSKTNSKRKGDSADYLESAWPDIK